MVCAKSDAGHRPRELRRSVVLPARMRLGSAWSDACILNISSHGMMIQASRGVPQGITIELQRGEYVVLAHVVWRYGARAGLQVEERLAVEPPHAEPGARLAADRGRFAAAPPPRLLPDA